MGSPALDSGLSCMYVTCTYPFRQVNVAEPETGIPRFIPSLSLFVSFLLSLEFPILRVSVGLILFFVDCCTTVKNLKRKVQVVCIL
ncbi:uncharacterized protein BDW43DRAFT_285530 [Aspergillus alliaceus]|uniref:uncharacterized protein n=1 Tax=Petromyces alliaceus TaxID=209559 RepID=UPI0012A69BB8|nr:uncharacterized protein BDW43DRAFT_285530 [Aspergillus alliaceus]KAB8230484.1 hypothetical protein BDW43DRAFT_285530 [Aspergillus alliaceus]